MNVFQTSTHLNQFPAIRNFSAIFAAAILLGSFFASTANANTTKVTDADDGKTIILQKHDKLEISLPVTAGTGYSWQVTGLPGKILKGKGLTETKNKEKSGERVGGTEYQIFRYEAKKAGSGKLLLQYSRPWEKNVAPAKIFSLNITVP